MNKEQKQYIIVGVLLLVLVGVFANSLKGLKKNPAAKLAGRVAVPVGGAPPAVAGGPAGVVRADEKKIAEQRERAKLGWGRNPFSASSEKEYRIGELQLKGISFSQDKKGFAFINNDIVKKGDIVGDYEVVEIEKARVLLRKDNQNFYLTFPGGGVEELQ